MTHNLLKGKRGIIFGALNEMSIAWKVAERAVEEGAIITLSNTPVAVRMGDTAELGKNSTPRFCRLMQPMLKIWRWFSPNQWKFWGVRSIFASLNWNVAECAVKKGPMMIWITTCL